MHVLPEGALCARCVHCMMQGHAHAVETIHEKGSLPVPTKRFPSTSSKWSGSANSASLAPPTHNTIALPFPLPANEQHLLAYTAYSCEHKCK